MRKTLRESNESLYSVFEDIEYSETKEQVKFGFMKLNGLMRYLQRILSQRDSFNAIRNALQKLGVSEKFREHLIKNPTLEEAIVNYKTEVLQLFATQRRILEYEDLRNEKIDKELFNRFLPEFKFELEVEVKENTSGRARKRRKLHQGNYKRIKDLNEKAPSKARKKDCIFYKKANCVKGNKCKFKHFSFN